MAPIAQLTKVLVDRPTQPSSQGLWVRNYQGTEDIEPWLEVRHAAFARQRVGVGRWDRADFEREFLTKPWWSPRTMWFCEAVARPGTDVTPLLETPRIVGTVTLASRDGQASSKPVVHWLAVLPRWRRQGVARLLMAALETYAWDDGLRQIWLETHTGWVEAAQFYAALGYRPIE